MRAHLCTFATATLIVLAAQNARGQCCGDCNLNGVVAINELIVAVIRASGQCIDDGVCDDIEEKRDQYLAERDQCVMQLDDCIVVRNQCVNIDLPSCQINLTQCDAALDECRDQCPQLFPATGQTTCWDTTGNEIDCIATGQDGELQAGATLDYHDNGDGTITDLNTDLMWEVKDDAGGDHDQENTYTLEGAFTFVRSLNRAPCFAGHCDWRMPNVKELMSIINFENALPAVSAEFNKNCTTRCAVPTCSCTLTSATTGWFYSSTTYRSVPNAVWLVNFGDGVVDAEPNNKSGANFVRAVRGGS